MVSTLIIKPPLYDPLVELAENDIYANELFDDLSIHLQYVQYRRKNYMLRGQIRVAWDSPPSVYNSYIKSHEEVFKKLGAIRVEDVFNIVSSNGWADGAKKRSGITWLYTPRAISFTAFIFETPRALAFQKKLGINVPIPLSTAFKYAGLTT